MFESRLRFDRRVMERAVARAGRTGSPLVVGPWLSEIGFEVLYWIPFLRCLFRRHGVSPTQVTALSRGGPRDWYRDIAAGYVDVHDLVDLTEFSAIQAHRIESAGDQKQQRVTPDDRRLLRDAGDGAPVHPLVMYSRLRYYWDGHAGARDLDRHCSFEPLARPAPSELPLPQRYVAAKPYFSDCFPDTPANREKVETLLLALADQTDVVLLAPRVRLDDHAEIESLEHPRIHDLGHLSARENLAVQTQVLAGAQALISTYGGFSYLAPFLGVPSFSFYSELNFNPAHLDAMHRAVRSLPGQPGFTTVDLRSLTTLMRSVIALTEA